jgi:hypothetical protein
MTGLSDDGVRESGGGLVLEREIETQEPPELTAAGADAGLSLAVPLVPRAAGSERESMAGASCLGICLAEGRTIRGDCRVTVRRLFV